MQKTGIFVSVLAIITLGACGSGDEASLNSTEANVSETSAPRTISLSAGEGFVEALQTALITAEIGDVIEMPSGTFNLVDGLSLDVDGVTLNGAGQGETILSFAGQTGAGEGLLVTSDDVTLTSFTMQDTAGDGIKSKGANRIIYRDLTVEWTGEPDETNGAYAIYPVESRDILIERVTARGASDAGIYVGQSKNIIVRNSIAEYNVAGIEIENSIGADVYNNIAQHNAGGILVFDLPDLPQVGGHSTRIFNNRIISNNTRNFAPPGNIVATVPSGTGVIILANENVHVFENELTNNRSAHVLLTAYQDAFTDDRYNPLPRNIMVRGNTYRDGGADPQGALAALAPLVGGTYPPIVWDGVVRWGQETERSVNLMIQEDESVGFINLDLQIYPINTENINPTRNRPKAGEITEPAKVILAHAKGS